MRSGTGAFKRRRHFCAPHRRGSSSVARPSAPRFVVYVALLFLILGVAQLAASLLFYQAIDRQTLHDDHARRIAELLVVSDRIHALSAASTSSLMTTSHLKISVGDGPSVTVPARMGDLADIAEKIGQWEPSLAGRVLHLATSEVTRGRRDLVGSMRLKDGRWLNFRSRDITSMWPVAFRAIALTFATTIACLGIGLIALHLLNKPLRRLAGAADAIGRGREVSIKETGPKDLRNLAHAMNLMQARIARLLKDQAMSFEAISHDLRTPLSRQKVAAELVDDPEIAGIVLSSVDEMEDLLASLQKFLRAQHISAAAETFELASFIREALSRFGARVALPAAGGPAVCTYREPLALTLSALAENAVQFGGRAKVTIGGRENEWTISIEDEGPGIPPEHFEAILDPFFRLDNARQRNTKGFGLGIPTAHRLMMRFNGGLSFGTSERGGLVACVTVPRA